MQADLGEMREGGVLWGYTHCAQQRAITQAALDHKLTLVAFEEMYIWSPSGQMGRHTFYKNNEMAGYCAVLHALQLKGIDGHYGNRSEEHTSELQSLMRSSYAVFCLKKKKQMTTST